MQDAYLVIACDGRDELRITSERGQPRRLSHDGREWTQVGVKTDHPPAWKVLLGGAPDRIITSSYHPTTAAELAAEAEAKRRAAETWRQPLVLLATGSALWMLARRAIHRPPHWQGADRYIRVPD